MDEFTRRLMSKRAESQTAAVADYEARKVADPVLAGAAALAEARVPALRAHGEAIVELLIAISEHAGCLRASQAPEQTQFALLITASRALAVKDAVIARCMVRLHGHDPAQIPDSFSFNDM